MLRRERRPDVASCRGLRGQLAHLGAGAVHPINSNSIPRTSRLQSFDKGLILPRLISCLSSQKRNGDKTVKRPGCTIIGTVVAKPEKREELLRILLAQVAPTRAEPGCVSYDFHCDAQDPCVFVFYENFRSREALDKHLQMPYLRPLMDRVDELCAEPIVIRHLHMLVDRGP